MLNIQQRAKRAAARKNNKLAKECPLFASQFAVTVDQQIERLQKMDVSTDRYFEKIHEADEARYKVAMTYRDVCAANMPAEKFAEFDARVNRIYGNRGKWSQPKYSGSFYADWWWQCIREFVPSYAQANCPNSQFHEWEIYQAEGECPTCKTRLTKRAADVGGFCPPTEFYSTPSIIRATGIIHAHPTRQAKQTVNPLHVGEVKQSKRSA